MEDDTSFLKRVAEEHLGQESQVEEVHFKQVQVQSHGLSKGEAER